MATLSHDAVAKKSKKREKIFEQRRKAYQEK